MMTDKNAKDSVSEQMQLALLTLALVQIFSTQDHAAAAIAKAGTSTASAWKCDTS
jgi:S-adenosylhomocysteine hydrolase